MILLGHLLVPLPCRAGISVHGISVANSDFEITLKLGPLSMDPFDAYALSLKPHAARAQIFLEGRSVEEILRGLREAGLAGARHRVIQKGPPAWVLVLLPSEDMRETVWKLTKLGFTKIRGINPSAPKPPTE